MPPTAGQLRVGRYFLGLAALFIVLYLVVALGSRPTPHLGLDLEGGTQVTLKAQTDKGKTPSASSMKQARQIIDNRVNGLGVANATTVIQGKDQIVISVPGKNGKGLDSVSQAALLQFRPFLQQPVADSGTTATTTTPTASVSATASATASGSTSATPTSGAPKSSATAKASAAKTSESGQAAGAVRHEAVKAATTTTAASSSTAKASATAKTSASVSASPSATATTAPAPKIFTAQPEGSAPVDQWGTIEKIAKQEGFTFTPPTTAAAVTALGTQQAALLQEAIAQWPCDNSTRPLDDTSMLTKPLITCGASGGQFAGQKYLLGPVVVQGKQVKSAQALAPGSQQGLNAWTVTLDLNGSGQKAWAEFTSKHNVTVDSSDVETYVANTLDSKVIEYSQIQSTITGQTQISGSFTSTTANDLANQLKYGALPLSFSVLLDTSISATLGSSQLKAGLLAGGIGLALVVLYSLLYYRALGLVTIASLIVSGGLTYAVVVIFGNEIGFTLTLAGIAGFIVAVGITADSFVVFFERIKDEVREGRTPRSAVPRAWTKALRTILSADFVSLLAAVILYWLASGDVRGFAFTLGLSTVLDLVVVVLFTHPLVSLLSRSDRFGNARFSGLSSIRRRPLEAALPGGGSVAVDDTPRAKPAPRKRPAARPAAEPTPAADETDSAPVEDVTAPDSTPGEPPPDRPAPAQGLTAAERAAARRARNRDNGQES